MCIWNFEQCDVERDREWCMDKRKLIVSKIADINL